MPYNLLLLPLMGGFLFIHLCNRFRFRAQRLDGYRLLVESAIAGTALAFLSRLIVVSFGSSHLGVWAASYWNTFAPFQYAETSIIAFLLGPLAAIIVNVFISLDHAKDLEIRQNASSFTQLLHRSGRNREPVSLTLDSRKWYVGFVVDSPNLDPQETHFRLLPILSGYRDKDTLQTYRTVSYSDVLESTDVNPLDFVITLPLKDVKIASLFDQNIYQDWFASHEPEDQTRH